MLYTLKGIILAGYAVQLAQASECTDKWSTVRCARQEKKGNCVPEAECPNPKKGGVKCKRANANCQATCGQCSSDDCAILVANLTSELEICTASLPVAAAGCPLQALTVEEGEQWCADTCPGLDMHVVSSNNQDDSFMSAGICVVVDATAGDVVSTTLTYYDDCLVVAGDNRVSDVNGLGGNDLMCGGPGNDDNFRGDDGNDTLNGGPGADNYFYGDGDGPGNYDGDDTIYGGPGDDFRFFGEGGDDKLYGGDGDDKYFAAGAGDDTLHGGAGDDKYFDGDAGDDTTYTTE